jgi:DNA mismatch endonuclease (patch repair protein)
VDIVSSAKRSAMMAGIRGKDTKPEKVVRSGLHKAGLRFRLHLRELPGTPDIVLPRWHVAVFVHGCFWHRHENCRHAKLPSSNTKFWAQKLGRNVERHQLAVAKLRESGWRVLTIWECATRDRSCIEGAATLALRWIRGDDTEGQIAVKIGTHV